MQKAKFLSSINLCIKLAQIKRKTGYSKKHKENNAEHSYQLAVVAWMVNHEYKLCLNNEKILKLALVHDLVEVYAGDVDAHGNKVDIAGKKERERKALTKLKKDYNNLKEIWKEVDEYEKKQSQESRLVNIVDKTIPDVHVYLTKDNYYKKRKVTMENWLTWLKNKVDYNSLHPKLKHVVDDKIKHISTEYKEIFFSK